MMKWGDVSFVVRSSNRKRVIEALDKPKTPTELSRELGLNLGYMSNLLIELLKRKMIKCLTPEEKRHRFYIRTKKGLESINKV